MYKEFQKIWFIDVAIELSCHAYCTIQNTRKSNEDSQSHAWNLRRWHNVRKKEIDLKRENIPYTTSQNKAYICIEIFFFFFLIINNQSY